MANAGLGYSYGYKGSPELMVSTENQDIFPALPSGWKIPYKFLEFTFVNDEACVVEINGEPIYLRAEQGFEATPGRPITSFVVKTPDVHFNWIAVY